MPNTYHREFADGQLTGKYQLVAQRIPPATSILEVGCHTGYFTRALRDLGHDVVGVEKDHGAASEARASGANVVIGDIETAEVLSNIGRQFDVVLLMDVLEHLSDPLSTLRALHRVQHANSRVLVTGPNVAYWAVRMYLMRGRWEYQQAGILDRTHLHFYTASSWRQLVEEAGYRVVALEPAEGMLPLESSLSKITRGTGLLNELRNRALALAPGLFTVVYLIEACPK